MWDYKCKQKILYIIVTKERDNWIYKWLKVQNYLSIYYRL